MHESPLFTVFTPSFNRAHTLHRPYRSLCAQTIRDFEWLVVDDGSVDDTRELVEGWRREGLIPIRYLRQDNLGKHVAFNHGVREANGELFLTLDSDDECTPNALERFRHHWFQIELSKRSGFSAVTCLCQDNFGRLVGSLFPEDPLDCSSQALRYKYNVQGEKWGFQRTKTLREFPFPEPSGVIFIPESVVWTAISRKYLTRYVNETLRIYYTSAAPNESLSTETDPRKHASGELLAYRSLLNNDSKWFFYAPMRFIMAAILYVYCSLLVGMKAINQFGQLRTLGKLLFPIAYPIALYKYLRDKNGWWGRQALKD